METAAHILTSLVCSNCEQLLKRGPVYQQYDEAALCGPCLAREDARPAFRCCLLYEATAELLRFPCRYREEGCPNTVLFVAAGSTKLSHEDACEYRKYVCPVLGSNRCDWAGRRNQLLQHCQDQHPDRVLTNPSQITPNIRNSLITDYIISAFQVLFLLHTRVCVSTAKLHYAVRLFGNPQLASNYSYTVTIRRGENVVIQSRDVLPQGLLVLQEHSALNLSINSLLSVLGGWDGAFISVEVKARGPQAVLKQEQAQGRRAEQERKRAQRRQVEQERKQAERRQRGSQAEPEQEYAQNIQVKQEWEHCVKCRMRTPRLYQDEQGWLCAGCAPKKWTCVEEGCDFQDIGGMKTTKHNYYFCQWRTSCRLCKTGLQPGMQLLQHYKITCNKFKGIQTGSRFLVRAGRGTHGRQWFLVKTAAGPVLCGCENSRHNFTLYVYAPVPCKQLHLHRCEVQLQCAGKTRTYTPDSLYDHYWDWEVKCKKDKFFTNPVVGVSLKVIIG